MKIQKAYKYRVYPTPEQKAELEREFGCARYVHNYFLRLRTDGFFVQHKRIGYNDTAKLLTELKRADATAFLQEVSNVVLQQSLRNLDAAFKNFFQGRAKYPKFKKKRARQSIRYTSNGFSYRDGKIKLAKQEQALNIRWSRPLPEGAEPRSVTVSKDTAGRYFISILVEEDIQPLPVVNRMAGLDLGLHSVVALSTGEKIPNPTYLRKAEKKLARAQKALSRKTKGSKNYEKAKRKVARIHAKVADCRNDFLHKLTTRLVNENQVLAAETLSVKNMARNHCLAQSIHDAGWGEWVRQLDYKCQWHGRTFVQVDRFYPSSKRCHACGNIRESLDLETRSWVCPECSAHHDRDVNAAQNILSAGLVILAGADKLRRHD